MPRIARGLADGMICHVINRGNDGSRVFQDVRDYRAFVDLMGDARERYPVQVLAWCLMPDHFHMLLIPECADDLGTCMQWLMTSHVRRHHRAHKSGGHIWHGRYKSFIVQEDRHLLETVRYIEANPVRGRLVSSASEWPWSSHAERIGVAGPFVDTLPIPLPDSWSSHVDTPLSEIQLERIQTSVRRQTPFGAPHWQTRICRELDLESTITPKGRPRKSTLKTSLSPY